MHSLSRTLFDLQDINLYERGIQLNRKEFIAAFHDLVAIKNRTEPDAHFEARISEWCKYERYRTYFAMIEDRAEWEYYLIRPYGYYDNIKKIYVADKEHSILDEIKISDVAK